MKKVFITGITGLLGTNLTNELLKQGYQLTAIVRDKSKYIGQKNDNLLLLEFGLFDDYDNYLNEVDIVIHIAAETATNLFRYKDYEKVNYDATIKLFEKAIKFKVSKFIFISTANTIGYGELLGVESAKLKKPFDKLLYAQSKVEAEKYLLSRKSNTEVKILNPTFMIGPYDSKPSSGKIILMGMNKKIVFYPPGGKNFVPVKDVVSAIISSFDKGKAREKYIIAGENLSYRDFFYKLNQLMEQKAILVPIPKMVLLFAGLTGSCLRILGIKTSLSTTNMRIICVKNYYNNKKSVDELEMRYSSLNESVAESIAYFKDKIK